MPITVNEGGTLYTLDTITVNEGGTLYELDTVHNNEGGVLYEIFSSWSAPDGVLWDCTTLSNSYSADKSHNEATTGTFTLKAATIVSMTGTWKLAYSGYAGTGSVLLSGAFSKSLNSGDRFSYTGELAPGDYTIMINGGGGNQSGTCGYHATCSLTFTKP